MAEQPNFFDRAVAFVLALRPLVYAIVVGVLVLCVITLFYSDDDFIQEWAIEIFGATLVFLAVYHVHPLQIRTSVFVVIVLAGAGLGVASYLFRSYHIGSALLVKISSGLMLFAILEVLLRQVLRRAKDRELTLAQKVLDTRRETLDALKKYATTVLSTGLSDQAMENYAEAMTKLVFPDGAPPPASEMVRDDPEWIAGWLNEAKSDN